VPGVKSSLQFLVSPKREIERKVEIMSAAVSTVIMNVQWRYKPVRSKVSGYSGFWILFIDLRYDSSDRESARRKVSDYTIAGRGKNADMFSFSSCDSNPSSHYPDARRPQKPCEYRHWGSELKNGEMERAWGDEKCIRSFILDIWMEETSCEVEV